MSNPATSRACRSEGSLIILRQERGDADGGREPPTTDELRLLFREGEEWSRPLKAQVRLNKGSRNEIARRALPLSCHGGEIALTSMFEGRIEQLRCKRVGCETHHSEALDFQPRAFPGAIRYAEVGDDILLVRVALLHNAISPMTKTLRYRLAPLGELHAAEEHLIVGDESHGGISLDDFEIFVRDGVAVLLINIGDDRWIALSIDRDGVRQLPVRRG